MALIHAALVELQTAVDPAVHGPVTVYAPSKGIVPGEYAYVQPDALDMGGIRPGLITQGVFGFLIVVAVQGIDRQDHAERLSSLLDPDHADSIQQHVWTACGPGIRFRGVEWGMDQTGEWRAHATGTFPLVRSIE